MDAAQVKAWCDSLRSKFESKDPYQGLEAMEAMWPLIKLQIQMDPDGVQAEMQHQGVTAQFIEDQCMSAANAAPHPHSGYTTSLECLELLATLHGLIVSADMEPSLRGMTQTSQEEVRRFVLQKLRDIEGSAAKTVDQIAAKPTGGHVGLRLMRLAKRWCPSACADREKLVFGGAPPRRTRGAQRFCDVQVRPGPAKSNIINTSCGQPSVRADFV
jgi:hypothetical protein